MNYLRLLSLVEGSSLILLLFVAVPLKRLLDFPIAVTVIGPIHGALFVMFILLLFFSVFKYGLKVQHAMIGFVASVIPFGSYWFKVKILNHYQ